MRQRDGRHLSYLLNIFQDLKPTNNRDAHTDHPPATLTPAQIDQTARPPHSPPASSTKVSLAAKRNAAKSCN